MQYDIIGDIHGYADTLTGRRSLREYVLMPDPGMIERLPDAPFSLAHAYDGLLPVAFGHYWLKGSPTRQSELAACVDYSAGKGDPLVAYRWEGEPQIRDQGFVSAAA